MALQKSIQSDSGVTTEYWKIREVKTDYAYSGTVRISIFLDGYLNEQFRTSGYHPTTMKSFLIHDPETWTVMCGTDGKNNTANNPLKLSYNWLKINVPDFLDAVDV